MTLPEAVQAGVLKNPTYGVAAQESLAAQEGVAQARSGYLPSIDLQGETGPEYNAYGNVSDENMWRSRTGLTLTQLLFDWRGTQSRVGGEKARAQSAAWHAGAVAEFAGLDTAEAYMGVLRQRAMLDIARENVDKHLRIFDMVNIAAEGGTATQGDVAQVQARLAQAKATVAGMEQNLRQAESLFAQKTGEMPATLDEPAVPRSLLSKSVSEAVRRSLNGNPALAAASATIVASRKDRAGVSSLFYPRFDLEASGSVGDNVGGVGGNNQSGSVLAVARWNLYRGGADLSRQREAAYREASARESHDETSRAVEKETRDTWAAMEAAAARDRSYVEQVAANEKVVDVYMDQFTAGRRTLLDVLDAQNELFSSRVNDLDAVYAGKFAVFRLLALEGKMLEALGLNVKQAGLE